MNKEQFTDALESSAASCRNWHNERFLPTRDDLYALMAEQFEVALVAVKNSKLQLVLDKCLTDKEIGFNARTSVPLKVVKYGFDNIDRKKASAYAIPIANAIEEGIKSGEFLDWLTKPHKDESDNTSMTVGLEGKRLKKVKQGSVADKDIDDDQKGEALIKNLLPFDRVCALDETPAIGSTVVLVGRVNHLKETEVITLLDDSALVQSALNALQAKNIKSPINHPAMEDIDVDDIALNKKPVKKIVKCGSTKGSKNELNVPISDTSSKKVANKKQAHG